MVILFDGVCNLCNGSVRFVLARDRQRRFRFASLQSAAAAQLLAGRPPGAIGDSIVLVEGERIYQQSTAVLRILRGLGAGWRLLYALIVVPRPLRDAVYRWVARNRYRWFGRTEACAVPRPEDRDRFL